MREMLRRRFRRIIEDNDSDPGKKNRSDESWRMVPDLVIVDGGKGQLGIAVEVLGEFELLDRIPVVGLAKREEEIFRPGESKPLWLKRGSPALHLVQRIRDEAHRFAITYHRNLRRKEQTRSKLDDVPGIGPARRKALLTYSAAISNASGKPRSTTSWPYRAWIAGQRLPSRSICSPTVMDISYDESQDESQAGSAAEVAADPAVALAQVIALMIQWGLRRDDVEHILYGAVTVGELRPRAILYEQDAPVTHVYLLTSGSLYQDRISAAAGSRRRVSLRREVGAGQLVGAYDLLYGRKHSTRTRAVEFCRYAAIDATALERLLYAFPELRKRIAPVDVMGRLRTVPLFRNLELTTLAYVAEAARQVHLQPDEAVYAEDAIADHIFIVNQGQIRLTWPDGAAMWLGNGMGFGVLNAPLPDPAHAEDERYGHWAHAVGEADVFVWPRLTLVELTNVDPERAERDLRDRRIEAIDATAPLPASRRNSATGCSAI